VGKVGNKWRRGNIYKLTKWLEKVTSVNSIKKRERAGRLSREKETENLSSEKF